MLRNLGSIEKSTVSIETIYLDDEYPFFICVIDW